MKWHGVDLPVFDKIDVLQTHRADDTNGIVLPEGHPTFLRIVTLDVPYHLPAFSSLKRLLQTTDEHFNRLVGDNDTLRVVGHDRCLVTGTRRRSPQVLRDHLSDGDILPPEHWLGAIVEYIPTNRITPQQDPTLVAAIAQAYNDYKGDSDTTDGYYLYDVGDIHQWLKDDKGCAVLVDIEPRFARADGVNAIMSAKGTALYGSV